MIQHHFLAFMMSHVFFTTLRMPQCGENTKKKVLLDPILITYPAFYAGLRIQAENVADLTEVTLHPRVLDNQEKSYRDGCLILQAGIQ
jgi:hypothetical protein